MTVIVSVIAMLLAAGCAWLLYHAQRKQEIQLPWICCYLTFVLPFAVGGFYTYTAVITVILMLVNLYSVLRRQRQLRFCFNLNTAAILLVVFGYCITPIWAADKGMAVFGILRYLPLLLYALTLMQYSPEQKKDALALVPLCGALMTVCSSFLIFVPNMESYVIVKGRLSGFMQYPNTFATFLLAGLVLNSTKETRRKADPLVDVILVFGIILSGSQTGFILLLAALIGIVLIRRNYKVLIFLGISVACALALAVAAANSELIKYADRFTNINISSESFILRLLYYKDALSLIVRNPFGLGYMGFRAVEGTFQTGVYSTTYVHNGLLQLLLDIGWIPSLSLAVAFLRTMFSQQTVPGRKLLLFVILGHCMLDFNLQFFTIWAILISTLDLDSGKEYSFRFRKTPCAVICGLAAVICIWLGTGDFCYQRGNIQAAMAITPFHTNALNAAMIAAPDTASADVIADRILKLNATHSLAYSAKANAALSQGNVLAMVEYKEQAIRCSRYSSAEYLDYFSKLFAVTNIYLQNGDTASAEFCLTKLRSIPDMMAAVNESTASFAPDSTLPLELPAEYQQALDMLVS